MAARSRRPMSSRRCGSPAHPPAAWTATLCATALDVLDSVEAVDDRQVRLTLTRAVRPVPGARSSPSCPSWTTRRSQAGADRSCSAPRPSRRMRRTSWSPGSTRRSARTSAWWSSRPPAAPCRTTPRSWSRCSRDAGSGPAVDGRVHQRHGAGGRGGVRQRAARPRCRRWARCCRGRAPIDWRPRCRSWT